MSKYNVYLHHEEVLVVILPAAEAVPRVVVGQGQLRRVLWVVDKM